MIEGERKLATIRRIAAIEPIEGADRIVCATVDGWKLVTQKDNYRVGDLCVYFEIDSFLPVREEFEFLRKGCFKSHPELGEGFRIKTIKLKGQVSQGLSLPIADFFNLRDGKPYYTPETADGEELAEEVFIKEGDDVTAYFGVQKYEKPQSGPGGNNFGPSSARGTFPSFIPKTDQERVQNCWSGVKKWIYFAGSDVTEITDPAQIAFIETGVTLNGFGLSYFKSGDQWFKRTNIPNDDDTIVKRSTFEATVKLDGSSETIYYNDGQVGVCSRNQDLKRDPENVFWKVAIKSHVLEALVHHGRNVAIQGELMGPGVQGNRENLPNVKLFVFDVYDIDAKRYMLPEERYTFLEELLVGYLSYTDADKYIDMVPLVGTVVFDPDMEVGAFLAAADGQKSLNHAIAEGIVFKSHELEGPTFKVISNKYLLGEKD